ncbi:MAG TPA: hypothetical protein DC024_00225, partial [Clostridiales bacterium]|nr:hypothetical protein [Clostridiales bacterium]
IAVSLRSRDFQWAGRHNLVQLLVGGVNVIRWGDGLYFDDKFDSNMAVENASFLLLPDEREDVFLLLNAKNACHFWEAKTAGMCIQL